MKHGLEEKEYLLIKQLIENNKNCKILLFGSRARGDYKNTSDIDLAITNNISNEEKYKLMNDIDLLDIIHKIDLVFINEKTKKELVESINRDGVEF